MFSNYPLDRIALYAALLSTLLGVLLSLWGLISTSSYDQVDFFPFFVILTGLWGILGFIEATIYYLSRSLKQNETIFTNQRKSLLLHSVWFLGSFIFSIVLYSIWNSQEMFDDNEESFGLANGLLFAEIVVCALPQFFAFGLYYYERHLQDHPSSSDSDSGSNKKSKHKKRKSDKSTKKSKKSNPDDPYGDEDGLGGQDDFEKQPLAGDSEGDYGMDEDYSGGSSKKKGKGKKGASTSTGEDAFGDEMGTDDGMGDPSYGDTSGGAAGGDGKDSYNDGFDGGGSTTDNPYASSNASRGGDHQSRSRRGGGSDPYADEGFDKGSAQDSYSESARSRTRQEEAGGGDSYSRDRRDDGRSTISAYNDQQSSRNRSSSSASHVHNPSTIDVELHSRGSITRAEWDPSKNRYGRMSVSPEPQSSQSYNERQGTSSYSQPRQNVVPYQAPPSAISPPCPVSPTNYSQIPSNPTSSYPVAAPSYPSYPSYPAVQSQVRLPYPTSPYPYQYSPPASPSYSPPSSPPPTQQYAYPPPSQYSYGQIPYYR